MVQLIVPTAYKSNIDFLLDEILKYHHKELSDFEFHIVCENKYNRIQQKNTFDKFRNIKFCGFVDDLYMKIIQSDVGFIMQRH